MAWANGYDRRCTITIDETQCGTVNSTNFSMHWAGTVDIETEANGGFSKSNGDDIIFTLDADAAVPTLLSWELESTYNASDGPLNKYWAQIPTVDTAANTVLYCFVGKTGQTFQGGAEGAAWNADFLSVYHFGTAATLATTDSSGNNVDVVTNTGVVAGTGIIGGGASSGTGDSLDLGVVAAHNFTGTASYTITAWFNTTAIATTQGLVCKFNGGVAGQWAFQLLTSSVRFVRNVTPFSGEAATDLSSNTWYYGAYRYDGTNVILRYNTTQDYGPTAFGSVGTNSTRTLLGSLETSSAPVSPFLGVFDEVHIVNAALSDSWLTAEYNNQKASSTFYSNSAFDEAAAGGAASSRMMMMGMG